LLNSNPVRTSTTASSAVSSPNRESRSELLIAEAHPPKNSTKNISRATYLARKKPVKFAIIDHISSKTHKRSRRDYKKRKYMEGSGTGWHQVR
jgi:hypothetical protein